ncbi:hypothetical protein [Roseibium aggregatum]|uniref:hypothetical protein n=1 Tax=Roseibium aggregatum TaxID=187304 RepID=UPI001F2BEBF9|nr:hypothetical protein [Roseibium aggregatum]
MTFSFIGVLLLVLSVPLWTCRLVLYLGLTPRSRGVLRRVRRHGESAIRFAVRTFAVTIVAFGIIFTLLILFRFLKYGDTHISSLSDIFRNRLYVGHGAIDSHVDTLVYDQALPVGLIVFCLVFSSGLALVVSALRDLFLIRKLKRRIARLERAKKRQDARKAG